MKALVLFANGSEEMEATVSCNVMTRAGIEVVRATVESGPCPNLPPVQCAYGMRIVPDVSLEEVMDKLDEFAIVVLPGGLKGSRTFCENELVQKTIKHFAKDRHVAAICAAPLALREAEIFPGSRVICYPGLEEQVTRGGHFTLDKSTNTIHDRRLITGHGPGWAYDFALTIVRVLKGEEVRKKVAEGMLVD